MNRAQSCRRVAGLIAVGFATLSGAACRPDPGMARGAESAASVVVLDGEFGDWSGATLLVSDPEDAPAGSPVDLGRLWGTDDPAWLYLSLEVGSSVNVQAMDGELHIVLDADGNPATGGSRWGLEGADVEVVLSRRDRPQPGGYGAGFAVRPVDGDEVGAYRSAYDLGVAGLPTHASDRFELRIARAGAADGLGHMRTSVRGRIVASRDGAVLDETPVWTHTFESPEGADPFTPTVAPLDPPGGSFRVAVWNVSEGSFREPADHARILGALRPDVVLLDEVYEEISTEALREFFSHPALAPLGDWSFVLSRGGGRQKTVVAARNRAVRHEPSMVEVDYDDRALDVLRDRTPETLHRWIEVERERNLSATGAWVEVDGREILFVPLDLQSAGYVGSFQDRMRVLQAETLARHVRAAAGPRAAPVVIGGDFNLVGGLEPHAILARGLDTDGSDLTRAALDRLGEASRATWRDTRRGPFAPGLLDMTLYSDGELEQVGGFVFATEDLTDAQLFGLGLERGLSRTTSDHLVVVTDFRVRR